MTSASESEVSPSSAVVSAVMPKLPVTVDTRGRVRTSKEQRRLILAEFERSGISAARFAQQAGLKYSTLAGWVQRHRRSQRHPRAAKMRLLEAVIGPAAATSGLVVHLPGGARVEIAQASQVSLAAALVRALEKPC
jgi:transposase-like protein